MRDSRLTAICFALAIIPLLGFWAFGLFDLDEGFYAAAAREMLRRGEWITPYFNGQPWFEKPILLYWLSIPSIRLFGEEFGPRLPSVLCSIGTIWAMFSFVRRHVSASSARLTILIYGSSLLAIGVGRMMLADPPLVLALTLAFTLFYDSISIDGIRCRRFWVGLALGFAVLAKGPVALVLFAAVAAVVYVRERTLREGFRRGWLWFTVTLVLVVSLWYAPAYIANGPVFVQKFLIDQNVGRFTGGDMAHTIGGPANWLFFLVIVLAGMLPWSFLIPWRWPRREGDDSQAVMRRYASCWALVIVVFFSLSGAKLPHYIAPALPALAIILGTASWRSGPSRREIGWGMAACGIAFVAVNTAFWFYYYGFSDRLPGFHAEVHSLTKWVRSQGGDVAIYQMSRREKSLGTGEMRLRETSHPSILFYLDSTALETDDFGEILRERPEWIITRWNRITDQDLDRAHRAGFDLQEAKTPVRQDLYRVYRLK